MISILRITASYLLIQKRLKPRHHFIRHVIGNILDEFGAPCRIGDRARLVAHNKALCLRARIHERHGEAGIAGLVPALRNRTYQHEPSPVEILVRNNQYRPRALLLFSSGAGALISSSPGKLVGGAATALGCLR